MKRTAGRTLAIQVWAVSGVVFLLAEAAYRLAARGISTVRGGLSTFEWVILVLLTAAFVLGEGVMALQRKWAPFVISRVARLRTVTSVLYVIGAPLYATGLIGPPRRGVARAWAGVAAIVAAVLIVSRFPEPWRGIVDVAVASALIWGALALVYIAIRTLRFGREI